MTPSDKRMRTHLCEEIEGSEHASQWHLPSSASYLTVDEVTANAVECLVNLLYLIRLRASVPKDVLIFVDMAKGPLETLVAAARSDNGSKADSKRE